VTACRQGDATAGAYRIDDRVSDALFCARHRHRKFAPTVDRPSGARNVYLTFEGLRESRTVADKHARVHVSLPLTEVDRLRQLFAELVIEDSAGIVI
jgi:hypothetical protein